MSGLLDALQDDIGPLGVKKEIIHVVQIGISSRSDGCDRNDSFRWRRETALNDPQLRPALLRRRIH